MVVLRMIAVWRAWYYCIDFDKNKLRWVVLATLFPLITLSVIWYRKQPAEVRKCYLLIVILVCVLYGNTLRNEYALDDELVTLNNERVQEGIAGIPSLWVSFYAQENRASYGYRPVVLSSFAIEYEFFGSDPHIGHLINLLLYALTGVVLFHLLLALFKHKHWILPLAIVLTFIVHPIHTEVVASLKNRDEILCLLFGLLSLKAFYRNTEKLNWAWLIWGVLSFLLALWAKVSVMTFAFLIPFTVLVFTNISAKRTLVFLVVLLIAYKFGKDAGRFLVDYEPSQRVYDYCENPLYMLDLSFSGRMAVAITTIGFYLKMLVLPHPLVFYYGYDSVPLGHWSEPITIILTALLIPCILFIIYRTVKSLFGKTGREQNPVIFGAIFFLVGISMFSNFVVPAVGIVAERFAYIPSIGFCIMAGYLLLKLLKENLEQGSKPTKKTKLVLGLLVLVCSVKVIARNTAWKDHLTLYQTDIENLPNSVNAHLLLAGTLTLNENNQQNINQRIQLYERALEIYPEHAEGWNMLGVMRVNQGNINAGQVCFLKSIAFDSTYAEAWFNAGGCYEVNYRQIGKIDELYNAFEYYDRALTLAPDYEAVYNRYLPLLFNQNQWEKSATICQIGVKEPNLRHKVDLWGNYAEATLKLGDTLAAIRIYEERLLLSDTLYSDEMENYYKCRSQQELSKPFAMPWAEKAHRQKVSNKANRAQNNANWFTQSNIQICNQLAMLYGRINNVDNASYYTSLVEYYTNRVSQ